MACPASDGSGASTYLDGFAAAERLFEVDKEAWKILTETAFKYRSMDEGMGWHLEAVGRIIEVDEFDERTVKGIRHNDLDRMGAMPKASVIAQGEDAVREWYDRERSERTTFASTSHLRPERRHHQRGVARISQLSERAEPLSRARLLALTLASLAGTIWWRGLWRSGTRC